MTEQDVAAPVVEKKTMDPVEIYRRNVRTMSNSQLSKHLRRKSRQKKSGLEGAWASILSIVFDNTKSSQVGGKIESYLR
jgi:hypothetical protein